MTLQINHKNTDFKKSKQTGFSLIETMVASTLGLFIMGGVITSFMGTKDSEQMRSTISEMDANARIALEVLRTNIAHAGYSSMRNIQGFDKPFYSLMDGVPDNEGCGTSGVDRFTDGALPRTDDYTRDSGGTTPTDGRSDILTTVFLADNPCMSGSASCATANINPKAMVYIDCAGGGADRDAQTVSCSTDRDVGFGATDPLLARVYNTFYLGTGQNDGVLYCRGSRGGTQPLVENIEYLQFLYGVTRSDGNTEYLRANKVEENDEWSHVTSVRIGLLIRSSQQVLKEDATKTRYILLDRNVLITDKRRLYRAYTTTVNLPNRNRGQVL